MTRDSLLKRMNELIRDKLGNKIGFDDRLIDSGIDSFGALTIYAEICDEYNISITTVFTWTMDMHIGGMIDEILSAEKLNN